MPIRPRYPVGGRPEASRQFTDREEFIAVFERTLSELSAGDYKVLAYYGVGGIGKSSLLRELCRRLEEHHPRLVWAVLDLATPTHRDVETALSWLRRELTLRDKVQFPSFDLALAQFCRRAGLRRL